MNTSEMKPGDFYFHVLEDGEAGHTFLAITPAAFFDENGYQYDDHLMIEDILPENGPDVPEDWGHMFFEEGEGSFDTYLSPEEARKVLLAHGFRESESFSKFLTERM